MHSHIRFGESHREFATEALDHHTFPFSYPEIDSSSTEALFSFSGNEHTSRASYVTRGNTKDIKIKCPREGGAGALRRCRGGGKPFTSFNFFYLYFYVFCSRLVKDVF